VPPDGVVMIVEDDDDTREAMSEAIGILGYRTVTATNGREALSMLRGRDASVPCVIVLDLMMPEMDGWELSAELKTDPVLASIPIVIVTADVNASRHTAAGEAMFLQKPVELSILQQTIRRFC
jgi:CheY-like chemotaxis protein